MLLHHSDIDECAEGTDICDQNCHNSVGNYYCSCEPGYRLHIDGTTCGSKLGDDGINSLLMSVHLILYIDIDECAEGTDGCTQTCTDTKGSYVCSCDTGYRLANDSHGCDGGSPNSLKNNIIIIAGIFLPRY